MGSHGRTSLGKRTARKDEDVKAKAEGPEVETVGRDQEVARIQKGGGQLTRELRILQGALEVMRHEQARFKSSSRAGNYYLPIARGMIWKLLADKTATAVSK